MCMGGNTGQWHPTKKKVAARQPSRPGSACWLDQWNPETGHSGCDCEQGNEVRPRCASAGEDRTKEIGLGGHRSPQSCLCSHLFREGTLSVTCLSAPQLSVLSSKRRHRLLTQLLSAGLGTRTELSALQSVSEEWRTCSRTGHSAGATHQTSPPLPTQAPANTHRKQCVRFTLMKEQHVYDGTSQRISGSDKIRSVKWQLR